MLGLARGWVRAGRHPSRRFTCARPGARCSRCAARSTRTCSESRRGVSARVPVGDLVSRLDGDIAEVQRFGTDAAAAFIGSVLTLARRGGGHAGALMAPDAARRRAACRCSSSCVNTRGRASRRAPASCAKRRAGLSAISGGDAVRRAPCAGGGGRGAGGSPPRVAGRRLSRPRSAPAARRPMRRVPSRASSAISRRPRRSCWAAGTCCRDA